MSVKIQKINLDLTIINFDKEMTPEEFAKELSNVTGREIWRYEKIVFLNGQKTIYKFFSGLGMNERVYNVYEHGSILVDNNSKELIGTDCDSLPSGFTQIGESHKEVGIGVGIFIIPEESEDINNPEDKELLISPKE